MVKIAIASGSVKEINNLIACNLVSRLVELVSLNDDDEEEK